MDLKVALDLWARTGLSPHEAQARLDAEKSAQEAAEAAAKAAEEKRILDAKYAAFRAEEAAEKARIAASWDRAITRAAERRGL